MSGFKPYPEVSLEIDEDSSAMRIADSNGETLVTDIRGDAATLERFVACWNACRKLYAPANHIEITEEYVKRLEWLRKDAWAMAQEAEAKLAAALASSQPEQKDAAA